MHIHPHTNASGARASWPRAAAFCAPLALMAGMAGMAAGCSGDLQPFEIHLDFRGTPNDEGIPGSCPGGLCATIPMACDGKLSIRVVQVDDPMRLHASECVAVPATAAGNLCALGNIDVPLSDLPPGMARIEIALWAADQLPDQQCPGQPLFDLRGQPLPTVNPQPVVAGAVYFDVGSARDAYVPMSCLDLAPLDRLDCRPPPAPELVVEMRDMESNKMLGPGDDIGDLIVAYVLLARTTDGTWVTTTDRIRPLDLDQLGDTARWNGTLDSPLDGDQELCVQVTDNALTAPIPVLTCFDIDPADAADGQLQLEAQYISQDKVNIVFQTHGLAGLPEAGMVIGRVAAPAGSTSVAGLTVIATETSAGPAPGQRHDVAYPAEDWATTAGVTVTTSHGYFLTTEVPYPSQWQVRYPDGVLGGKSPYRGGLIQNVINAVRIPVGEAP